MNVQFSVITDVGIERTNNEDSVIVCADLSKQKWETSTNKECISLGMYGALMVVADGMGGANAGEIASSIAINTIKRYFSAEKLANISVTHESAQKFLFDAIRLSNEEIMQHVISDPDSIGLGTTIVIIWIMDDVAYIAWCGDSRCYSYNQNEGLKQITKDHSYVQELIDKGEITKKQAFNHPNSNIITKCLGDVDTVSEPDFIAYKIKDGDILLACSDGLCGYCEDKSIEKVILNNFEDLQLCRDNLLMLALKAGGHDNITIALCAVLSDDRQSPMVTSATRMKRYFKRCFGI